MDCCFAERSIEESIYGRIGLTASVFRFVSLSVYSPEEVYRDWNAVSAIAGVVAAIFVALTVVYLAIQIKRSTQATHSQTYHFATSALAEMAAIIDSDKERSRIFRVGMVNPNELTEDEFTQFGYLGISLFRRFENVFFQYQSGMINEDFWVGHRDNILWFFHRPGMQAWWQDRKFAFSQRFRASIMPAH